MRTVFHVSAPDQLAYTDAKVTNLIADTTVETERIAVVLDSAAVIDAAATDLREVPGAVLAEGASFLVCSNALRGAEHGEDQLPDGVEVVSSGVGELTRLQEQGYAYIRL
jgi:hypothetical protein